MALEKATITNTVTHRRTPVLFNPEAYSLTKDVNYAHIGVPGLGAPVLQFVHGNAETLTLELFLDTYEENRDVREETSKIREASARLPERYRAVLALHYQQGLTHEETAEVLGVSRGALRVLLHRAVMRLREEVKKK